LETDPLPLAGHLLWDIQFYPFSSGMAFSILIVLLLLFFSALISGSEIAYFSLGPSDRAHLEKNRNRRNILVLKNLEHPETAKRKEQSSRQAPDFELCCKA